MGRKGEGVFRLVSSKGLLDDNWSVKEAIVNFYTVDDIV